MPTIDRIVPWNRIDFGFVCRYTPTIQDGPVFRWNRPTDDCEISASRKGVAVSGDFGTMNRDRLDKVVMTMHLAAQVYGQLAKDDRPETIAFGGDEVKWSTLLRG
jgi:hypothetical protein